MILFQVIVRETDPIYMYSTSCVEITEEKRQLDVNCVGFDERLIYC